jgi:peptidoglycan hydrolase-like protein with peptidoglycan-binding domain
VKKLLVSLTVSASLLISSYGTVYADYNFSLPVYKKGTTHQDVSVLQQALKEEGLLNIQNLTDYYGTLTSGAVIEFQKRYGLKADGIAGSQTISKMRSLGLFNNTTDNEGNTGLIFTKSIYKKGEEHRDIAYIQEALKKAGIYNHYKITNYFGPITERAVKVFQQRYGLKVDGIVGSQTISKMKSLGLIEGINSNEYGRNRGITLTKSIYKKGEEHRDIAYIQEALKKAGIYNHYKTTNYFGPITERAVKVFQQKYGLKADGIVGSQTIGKMKELGLLNETNVIASRSGYTRYGEYLDWWSEVRYKLVNWNDVLTIRDFDTGITFKVKVTGGTNHADVEPLTKDDAEALKRAWGGQYSWARRSVIVYTKGKAIAASMNGMPHAGIDNKPSRVWVTGRSGGYGTGLNYDSVKGNNFDGHVCLHFKNSTTHSSNRRDVRHQNAVKKAAGLIR